MTDHEHHPHSPETPERPEQQAPAPDRASELLELARLAMRHLAGMEPGSLDAFSAYLSLNVEVDIDSNEREDFEARYIGFFPDQGSFIRDRITAHGWSDAMSELQTAQGMWPDDLKWNETVLLDHLSEQYALVERDGGLYAFRI